MMRRRIILALTLVLGTVGITAPSAASSDTEQSAPCVWLAQFHRTLAELGEDRSNWHLHELDYLGGYGTTHAGTAYLDPDTPCRVVGDVVRHEWMHLQQERRYGSWGRALDHYASTRRAELVADCGSALLGSDATPYLDRARDRGDPGCAGVMRTEARMLIDQ